MKILEDLILTIRSRKNFSSKESYTKKLLDNKELAREKVEEEIKELIEAVNKNDNEIHEAADVLYHLTVYLEANNIKIEDVLDELERRKK